MATAHLVHGYLGAGKTTFARDLEASTGGLRISADEWYLGLYVGEPPTGRLVPSELDRLMVVLDGLWPQLLARGIDVILDFGFWTRSGRDQARDLARSVGASARLWSVVCDEEVARARCLARNDRPSGSFLIDSDAFDALKAKFETLDDDEDRDVVHTSP